MRIGICKSQVNCVYKDSFPKEQRKSATRSYYGKNTFSEFHFSKRSIQNGARRSAAKTPSPAKPLNPSSPPPASPRLPAIGGEAAAMAILLRRASLRRVIAFAAASSSSSSLHSEVQPSLTLLYLSFFFCGWGGLGWWVAIIDRTLNAFNWVFHCADWDWAVVWSREFDRLYESRPLTLIPLDFNLS